MGGHISFIHCKFGILAVALSACTRAGPRTAEVALGQPVATLSAPQRAAFARGLVAFTHKYTTQDGLGPHFNAEACSDCRDLPTTGGHGRPEIKARVLFDAARGFVGVLPTKAVSGHAVLTVPAGAVVDFRRGPPLFGLGLLEQVTDAEMAANCDPTDRDGDGVRGHTNPNTSYDGRPGKFGLQAHTSSIRDFIGNALAGELGVTNDVNRDPDKRRDADGVPDPEASPQLVDDLTAFVAGLAPPPRAGAPDGADADELAARRAQGQVSFAAIGCAVCHKPDPGAQALGAVTDLCVHSLGPAFDSKIVDFSAQGDQWRTAPLWGLRFRKAYFHDARTADLDAAVRMHGGEAAAAAGRYAALTGEQRQSLRDFLDSL